MDIKRSMIINSDLPLSLWNKAIKIIVYILNKVPTKMVSKTPFEVWKGWKPSLGHVHMWGYQAELTVFNQKREN